MTLIEYLSPDARLFMSLDTWEKEAHSREAMLASSRFVGLISSQLEQHGPALEEHK